MKPISICTIMKNEEKHIKEFITSITEQMDNYPYEIILLDTGSDDDSVSIASEYGINVYFREWNNNFSSMRNYAASLANNDLILALDCDEYIRSINPDKLAESLFSSSAIGKLTIQNHYNTSEGDEKYTTELPRIYNRKYVHFEGSVHEQLVLLNGNTPSYVSVPLFIDHVGYSGSSEEMEKKCKRDLNLLFEDLKNNPDNPYTLFQIGQCYNMLRDDQKAYEYYSQGLKYNNDVSFEYVRMMVTACGYNMIHLNKYDEAIPYCQYYDTQKMDAPYYCMSGLVYLRSGQYIQAMQTFLQATSFPASPIEGCNTYIPLYNMGLINEMLGNPQGAKSLYKNCGDYPPAKERLISL